VRLAAHVARLHRSTSKIVLSNEIRQHHPTLIPLVERLVIDLTRLRGAYEHDHILELLVDAKGYRLNDKMTSMIDILSRENIHQVEQNLDLLRLPEEGALWIEYHDHARQRDINLVAGTAKPINVGALICADHKNPNRWVIITAWDFPDGSTRHSYAVASFQLEQLYNHAWLARNRFSNNPEDVMLRLMALFDLTIPPGLTKEIKALEKVQKGEDWNEVYNIRAKSAAMDVVEEIPFILSAMLALQTKQITTTSMGIGRPRLVSASPIPKSWIPWLHRRGLHRHGSKKRPELSWVV